MICRNGEKVATDETHGIESFAYTEWAIGGLNRRNDVRPLKDSPTVHGRAECYWSILRFTESLKTYRDNNNGSVAGYEGAAKADFLFLDFDDEDDPANALKDLVLTLGRLEALGVPLKALGIYYSGHKGFHAVIQEELFGGLEGGLNTAARLERVACKLLGDSETADRDIYETLRLLREPNTKNGKSELYKVPLYPEEILNRDIEEIRDLAKHPRDDFVPTDPGEFDPVPELRCLWRESKEAQSRNGDRAFAPPVGEVIPNGQGTPR